MHMLKLLFQKLQIRPILAPGKSETTDKAHPGSRLRQPTSWDAAKDYRLGTSRCIQAIVFQGGANDHLPLGTANRPGQECCSFFYLTLPELQNQPW